MLRNPDMDGERFAELVEVMRRLLGPGGCPWDRAQTPESMRRFVIEEAFELVEAIDAGDPSALREELGDLLMQVVFLGELAADRDWFTTADAIAGIRDKLVRRHPHVFGDATAKDAAEVLARWEAIKREEKQGRGLLDGIPVTMPALSRAVAVGEKAARVGYDWTDAAGVRQKIDEELAELDGAPDPDEEEKELGDLLFAIASWARKRGHDPEAALRRALDRFGGRMRRVEAKATADGVALESLDADALDDRWRAAKAEERE
ncbi:MAG: nucleoside triphosphate pyrophosphohydrolase [Myxococcales bacterium]|nr:nucleoside triphosphate pyrophosphohydrolase [Myxococcales bacterium]